MKKVFPLVILLLFVSFQAFQLCDETGDAVEAIGNYFHTMFQKSAEWTSHRLPYEDADASFPLVIGQSLTHSRAKPSMVAAGLPISLFIHHPATDASVQAAINDRSPPHPWIFEELFPVASLILDRSPARSLAPPLI